MSFLRLAGAGARAAPVLGRIGAVGRATGALSRLGRIGGTSTRGATGYRGAGSFHRATARAFRSANPLKRYKFGKKGALFLGGGSAAALGLSGALGGADPFKGKGILSPSDKKRKADDISPSLFDAQSFGYSAAQKMLRGKAGRRKTYRTGVYGPSSKAMMPVRRRSTKRKRAPAYKAKKKTRKIRKAIKGVKKHYDDYGSISREYCNWLGVQHHGAHARMLHVVGESIIRSALAKMGCYPATYADSLSKWFGTTVNMSVTFRRNERNSGTDQEVSYTKAAINTLTYDALTTAFVFDNGGFRDMLLGNAAQPPNADTVSYYPTDITFTQTDGTRLLHILDLEASYITFSSYIKMKLQNKTLNDQGAVDLDAVGQNPLQGKTYFFPTPAAKVRSDLQQGNALYDRFTQEDIDISDTGIIPGPAITNASDAIAHPVRPQAFFKNCQKTTSLGMVPGGAGTLALSFKFKGTLQKFCEKATYTGYGKPGIGQITWIAMEKKFRDSVGANSKIVLGYNRDSNLYANTLLRSKKYMLRTHNDTNMGAI